METFCTARVKWHMKTNDLYEGTRFAAANQIAAFETLESIRWAKPHNTPDRGSCQFGRSFDFTTF